MNDRRDQGFLGRRYPFAGAIPRNKGLGMVLRIMDEDIQGITFADSVGKGVDGITCCPALLFVLERVGHARPSSIENVEFASK